MPSFQHQLLAGEQYICEYTWELLVKLSVVKFFDIHVPEALDIVGDLSYNVFFHNHVALEDLPVSSVQKTDLVGKGFFPLWLPPLL
jgi:hypothetical protein